MKPFPAEEQKEELTLFIRFAHAIIRKAEKEAAEEEEKRQERIKNGEALEGDEDEGPQNFGSMFKNIVKEKKKMDIAGQTTMEKFTQMKVEYMMEK